MPASWATSATRCGDSVRSTPRASSTSAEPEDEEAARLPCLTTRTPLAAMTMEDIVEMLTVCERSPPVPTMSRLGPGTSIGLAWASIMSARPRSSSTVSPLARSATRNPASCTGDASPRITSPIAHAAWSVVRSRPAISSLSRSGQVAAAGAVASTGSGVGRGPAAPQLRDGTGQRDRVERVRHGQVRERPGGQPAVLRAAGEDQDGRAVEDLALELAAQAETAGGGGLAVEDDHVEARVLDSLD